ncbi:MAG: carboxylating nicotinate-nucleotide diphosphorylase [Candidatus Aquicultorales bacterium]
MLELDGIDGIIRRALAEDIGAGDITTNLVVGEGVRVRASILARQTGILAGLPVASRVFALVDADVAVRERASEGSSMKAGDEVLVVAGAARSVFAAERTALNFLQHLSGVATLTAAFVARTEGTPARIFDTRKTLPGLRILEKYAVSQGKGENHRLGLFDAVLIKDNHLKAAGGVGPAVKAARRAFAGSVEVEVETLDELEEAIASGADIVMLDNMSVGEMKSAVDMAAGRVILEASGGVSMETVRAVAETGVGRISVGAITQGAPPLDFSLEVLEILEDGRDA